MIDGRFDQHFLEIFARSEHDEEKLTPVPWVPLILALTTVIAIGAGTLILA